MINDKSYLTRHPIEYRPARIDSAVTSEREANADLMRAYLMAGCSRGDDKGSKYNRIPATFKPRDNSPDETPVAVDLVRTDISRLLLKSNYGTYLAYDSNAGGVLGFYCLPATNQTGTILDFARDEKLTLPVSDVFYLMHLIASDSKAITNPAARDEIAEFMQRLLVAVMDAAVDKGD